MSELNIEKILNTKYQQNLLANFYILKYNPETTNPKIWVENFLKLITPVPNHPDTLYLSKPEKDSEYKVDDPQIKHLLNFLQFRPVALKNKFVFIYDAQDLSTNICNKLLKTFEELQEFNSIFLLSPIHGHLLPTIESRAIKLVLNKNTQFDDREQKLNPEAIELASLINSALSNKTYSSCDKLLENLKEFERASTFNNQTKSKLAIF